MREELPPICVLAGGLATRLGERAKSTPKALVEVAGEPFILHQLRLLASHGARRVVVCVGYLGGQIVETVGDSRFGIEISYSHDGDAPIGTLAAIRQAAALLDERFLVLYGDTYLRLDYRDAARSWQASGQPAMMTVLRNHGRWDVSNAVLEGELVTAYDKRAPTPDMQWIDYGLGGLERRALDAVDRSATDVSDLYHVLAGRRRLFGYPVSERFYEIGTPQALAETDSFLRELSRS